MKVGLCLGKMQDPSQLDFDISLPLWLQPTKTRLMARPQLVYPGSAITHAYQRRRFCLLSFWLQAAQQQSLPIPASTECHAATVCATV